MLINMTDVFTEEEKSVVKEVPLELTSCLLYTSKEGKLPAAVVACVGGGSNAMGMFYNFIPDEKVQLIGCEAAGRDVYKRQVKGIIFCNNSGNLHVKSPFLVQF